MSLSDTSELTEEELELIEGEDPWASLPAEVACEIFSNITDVEDVVQLMQTSQLFQELAPSCIRHLTTSRLVTMPADYLALFPIVRTVDFKIIINADPKTISTYTLRSMPQLHQAYFTVDERLIGYLLRNLVGLDKEEHYFKIALITHRDTVGILIKDSQYLVIPEKRSYINAITIMEQVEPSLTPLLLPPSPPRPPRSAPGPGKPYLLRTPMRQFLRVADFGLIDPTQPPSGNNPPLSTFIELFTDVMSMRELQPLLLIYVFYHQLLSGAIIQADDLMKQYFQSQVDNYTRRPFILSGFIIAHLTTIIALNRLTSTSIEEIAEYEFPNIPTQRALDNLHTIVTNTRNIYQQLRVQARTTPGIFYYTTEGERSYLS